MTVHRMDPEIDAGPIVYQTRFPIEAGDTALSLSFKCVREGVTLMQRLLEVAEKGDDLPLFPAGSGNERILRQGSAGTGTTFVVMASLQSSKLCTSM